MSEDREPIRTLIVDDQPQVCRIHELYVQHMPAFEWVGSIHTAQECLDALVSTPVDLVLLDIDLPDFSGIEMLRRYYQLRSETVDVIMVSSFSDEQTVKLAGQFGLQGYLIKPFTRGQFTQKLLEYAEQRHQQPRHAPFAAGVHRHLSQAEVDEFVASAKKTPAAMRAGAATPPEPGLPKGLSHPTLELVIATLEKHEDQSLGAADVGKLCDISRVTARRYLEYLCDRGITTVEAAYGKPGRPQLRYRLVESSETSGTPRT